MSGHIDECSADLWAFGGITGLNRKSKKIQRHIELPKRERSALLLANSFYVNVLDRFRTFQVE